MLCYMYVQIVQFVFLVKNVVAHNSLTNDQLHVAHGILMEIQYHITGICQPPMSLLLLCTTLKYFLVGIPADYSILK